MKSYILKLSRKENLTQDEIQQIMQAVMKGETSTEEVREILLLLNSKGPTVEEITGAAKIMRQFSVKVRTRHEIILDTCGTGGDKKDTFNISTIAAFVVAGAGVVVAKHGNRSVSSRCGSACILEALGVNLEMGQKKLGECLDKVGMAFLFAQKLHPAMKNVASVRKSLGVKTIFNILGPLTNPAGATHQMVGVYSRDLLDPVAQVLRNLGLKRALVVHGHDGLDEVTTTGITFVSEFTGQEIVDYDIDPQELGIRLAQEKDLKGGDIHTNVRIAKDILQGTEGPKRDIVVLNAACALYASEKVKNISAGISLAVKSIDGGSAKKKLEELIVFSRA